MSVFSLFTVTLQQETSDDNQVGSTNGKPSSYSAQDKKEDNPADSEDASQNINITNEDIANSKGPEYVPDDEERKIDLSDKKSVADPAKGNNNNDKGGEKSKAAVSSIDEVSELEDKTSSLSHDNKSVVGGKDSANALDVKENSPEEDSGTLSKAGLGDLDECTAEDDYIAPYSRERLLREILKKYKIKSSTWIQSIDSVTTMVTFLVESGRKEEDVLDALVTCGIGKEAGTSLSISPTTVCLSGELDKQAKSKKPTAESLQFTDTSDKTSTVDTALASSATMPRSASATNQTAQLSSGLDEYRVNFSSTDAHTEADSLLEKCSDSEELSSSLDIAEVEESDFSKSIKARIIIQPIVATLRRNAEFTFDYLAFVIMASIISAVGLIENNSVILVASMLISPLMGPILAATFGNAVEDTGLRYVGIKSELIGLTICVVTGFCMGLPVTYIMSSGGWWTPQESWPSPEMYSRGLPRGLVIGAVIATVSGMAVALSVLGNNMGSLVGVAISASLLPPAVNCGLLWAHSLQSAIDSLFSSKSIHDSVMNVTVNGSQVDPHHSAENVLNCSLSSTNNYVPHFTCNMAQEMFYLGLLSLLLTLVNILLIVLAAMLCLKVKQVSPRASVANEQVFWTKHLKVAKHYNTTVRPSTDYWAGMVRDLRTNLKVSEETAERIIDDGHNRRRFKYDLPGDLLRERSVEESVFRNRTKSLGEKSLEEKTHSLRPHMNRQISHAPKLESAEFGKRDLKVQGRFTVEKKDVSSPSQPSNLP